MIAPRNLVLALVLAALVAANVLLGGETRVRVPRELFPAFLPKDALRVEIETPDGSLVLQRNATEEPWILPGSADYPAREERVGALLDRLAALSDLDLLTEEPARAVDYGLGEGASQVSVFGAGDVLLVALEQGDAAPATRGGAAHYVRAAGGPRVVRAPRWSGLSARPVVWLDTRWVRFEPALLRALEIEVQDQAQDQPQAAKRERRIEREDVERWRDDAGQVVRAAPMRAVLDRLRSVFFDEVVSATASAALRDAPAALLRLETNRARGTDELRVIELRLGARAADGSREAQVDETQVVRLGPEMAAALVETLGALIDVEGLR